METAIFSTWRQWSDGKEIVFWDCNEKSNLDLGKWKRQRPRAGERCGLVEQASDWANIVFCPHDDHKRSSENFSTERVKAALVDLWNL